MDESVLAFVHQSTIKHILSTSQMSTGFRIDCCYAFYIFNINYINGIIIDFRLVHGHLICGNALYHKFNSVIPQIIENIKFIIQFLTVYHKLKFIFKNFKYYSWPFNTPFPFYIITEFNETYLLWLSLKSKKYLKMIGKSSHNQSNLFSCLTECYIRLRDLLCNGLRLLLIVLR